MRPAVLMGSASIRKMIHNLVSKVTLSIINLTTSSPFPEHPVQTKDKMQGSGSKVAFIDVWKKTPAYEWCMQLYGNTIFKIIHKYECVAETKFLYGIYRINFD